MSSADRRLEVMGCATFVQFSFFTIGWRNPNFLAQGPGLELVLVGTPKNSFHVDGETFKHPGGSARVRIAWKSAVNLLRYEG